MLLCVASVRRIAADNFIDTARPPASSKDELIRDPLESRAKLLCRFVFVLFKLYAAHEDTIFVLTVIIPVFLYFFLQLPRCYRVALNVFDLTFSGLIPEIRFVFLLHFKNGPPRSRQELVSLLALICIANHSSALEYMLPSEY
jgi:hypothetical protein